MNEGTRRYLARMGAPECRWCASQCDAEFVDVGVGHVQVTPGICDECGAVQTSPQHRPDGRLTEVEMATGWYAPFEDHPDYSPFNPNNEVSP